MALQNILPNIQADAGGAQLRLHPVPVPNGLAETGRMMSDAGQGLMKASFGLMVGLKRQNDEMVAKEDALALAEAKNAYTKDMTTHITELMKKTGSEAKGITEQFKTYNGNSFDRWSQTLSPNNQRLFKMWAEQQGLSYWQRVQNHEDKNVTGAKIDLTAQTADSDLNNFAVSGDMQSMYNLIMDTGALYEATYGDSEDQEAMTKYVQSAIDKALGARLDYLFKNGDIEGGIAFYDSIGKDGMPNLSEEMKTRVEATVNQQRDILNVRTEVNYLGQGTALEGGAYSYGGLYHTAEQDLKRAEMEEYLSQQTDPLAKLRLAEYRKYMDNLERVQDARLTAEYTGYIKDLGQGTTYESHLQDYLKLCERTDAIPDGTLLHAKMVDARNKAYKSLISEQKTMQAEEEHAYNLWKQLRNDSEKQRKDFENDKDRQYLVETMKIGLHKYKPSVRYNGMQYDLTDHDTLETFLYEASWQQGGILTDKDIEYIRRYMGGGASAEWRNVAEEAIMNVFNRGRKTEEKWTMFDVARFDPTLTDDVLEQMAFLAGEKGKLSDTDKTKLFDYITKRFAESRGGKTRMEAMEDCRGKDGGIDLDKFKPWLRGDKQTQEEFTQQNVELAQMANASSAVPENTNVVTARAEVGSNIQYNAKQEQIAKEKADADQARRDATLSKWEQEEIRKNENRLAESAKDAVRKGISEEDWKERVEMERRSAIKGYPWLENTPSYRPVSRERLTEIYRSQKYTNEQSRRTQEKETALRNAEISQQNESLATQAIEKGMTEQELRTVLIFQFGRGAATKEDLKRVETVLSIYRKMKEGAENE